MKIGILTYHAACNFGANLQVLSTFCYLKKHGHEPIIINLYTEALEKQYKSSIPPIQYEEHKRYREKYLNLTERCYTTLDVAQVIKKNEIDAVIVGSDAVAQHHPLLSRIVFPCRKIIAVSHPTSDRMCPNPFWGDFLSKLDKKIPLAMMSVSSQNSAYRLLSRQEKNMLNKFAHQLCYISTRDTWTSKMFKYVSDGEIVPTVTPDPVFAFNYNVDIIPSKEEIVKRFNLPDKYYLFSFHNSKYVSVEWLRRFQDIAQNNNIDCVALPFPAGITFNHPFNKEIQLPLNPLDWYALIKYSAGYIGNNMHPIVVSLHNAVPCFSFDNYGIVKFRLFTNEKSSKIYHILNRFNLSDYRTCCIGLKYNIPSPEYVYQKLNLYNKDKISKMRDEYYNEYKQMMGSIIQTFQDYA